MHCGVCAGSSSEVSGVVLLKKTWTRHNVQGHIHTLVTVKMAWFPAGGRYKAQIDSIPLRAKWPEH